MIEIRKQFKGRMKELGISNQDMAEKIGRSASALSNYFNGLTGKTGRSELDFYNLKLLARELYRDPIELEEVMKEVVISLERPDNVKCVIEFASFREYPDMLEELLNKAADHKNRELNEWSKVYSVHLKFLKKEITALEMMKEASCLNVEECGSKELVFFQKWMMAYGHYKGKNFSIMMLFLNRLESTIKEIHNEYLQQSYLTRFYLLCGNFNLFNNTLEKAKYYYCKVIERSMSSQKIAHAYHGLGLCFMTEDKQLSHDHFKKAIQIFESIENHEFTINAKHAFNMSSNWNNGDEFYDTDYDCMKLEVVHRYIKRDEKKKASALLDLIEFGTLDIQDKGFYELYKGLLNDDIDSLYMSVMYFKKSGNKFYSLLPCKELIKRGERPAAIFAAYGEIVTLT